MLQLQKARPRSPSLPALEGLPVDRSRGTRRDTERSSGRCVRRSWRARSRGASLARFRTGRGDRVPRPPALAGGVETHLTLHARRELAAGHGLTRGASTTSTPPIVAERPADPGGTNVATIARRARVDDGDPPDETVRHRTATWRSGSPPRSKRASPRSWSPRSRPQAWMDGKIVAYTSSAAWCSICVAGHLMVLICCARELPSGDAARGPSS